MHLIVLVIGFWLAMTMGPALGPAVAQSVDIRAAQTRFQDLYSAGNYKAALAEAQKTEAAAKRNGTNNIAYISALSDLARAHNKLGHYADAARMFGHVFDTLRKNIPANDPRLIQARNNLADVYVNLTRYDDAARLYQQSLDVMATLLPVGDPAIIEVTTRLGTAYLSQSRHDAAEVQFKRALALAEQAGHQNSTQVAVTLNNLTKIYEDQGRFAAVEDALQRALKINETALGANHPEVAINLNNLAHLYERLGRYTEAEGLYRRVIAVWEALNPRHPELATALQNLGTVFADEERLDEAEALYKRALGIREEVFGASHFLVATELNNLAQLYEVAGRFGDVETFARRALAIVEKARGPDHPDTAKVLRKLGVAYDGQKRYREAEAQFSRALDIYTRAFGPDHRFLATVLINQGHLYEHQHRFEQADAAYRRALAINRKTRGESHPDVARVLNDLAVLSATRTDIAKALAYSRAATAAVLAHAGTDATGPQRASDAGGLIERRADFFANHVTNLAAAARASLEPPSALGREAFEIAQWVSQSSAAAAVQQMSARFASGSSPLVALARENQDLTAAWRETDRRLLETLGQPDSAQNRVAIETLRKRSDELDRRLSDVLSRLEKEFPEYAALVRPRPIKVADVQALLSDSEVLIFWLPGEKETYAFALTRDGFDWKTIPLSAERLLQMVATFRVGLDPEKFDQSLRDGKPQPFDLAVAHELYAELFGPLEPQIKGKSHLIVAATGPLTALPLHALVTEKPASAKPAEYEGYRNAAWLAKRYALTVVPSVASFQALRKFAQHGQGRKPLIGFGDPIFGRDPSNASRQRGVRAAVRAPYTEFWRGAGVDRAALSTALPQLPDTADELKAVAERLGAASADVHLGRDASETTLKHARLADYRIVYFATHGLVAGDVKGLGEPALVLTLPAQPNELDDGLLTASEAAQLKLNADFVVLSACNTIAGDKPGAEALSGLARAFFYAGARAMLVSHWSVESKAATEIVTGTFKNLSAANVGRAEALRQAMLTFMNNPAERGKNAYPAYWAPFVVIGEGALQ